MTKKKKIPHIHLQRIYLEHSVTASETKYHIDNQKLKFYLYMNLCQN